MAQEREAMAQKFQFFRLIRELFQKSGIHPIYQSNQNRTKFNFRNLFIFLSLAQTFVYSVAYLLYDADAIEEYGQSFYASVTILLLLFLWPTFIHNMGNLFDLMDQMDGFGQKRKWINKFVMPTHFD